MRRVVMGPRRRKTSARTTQQRAMRVASVEISRQTARSAVGKSQLAQRTNNAATVITDTISTARGLSATAVAPETSIREMRASPRSLPGSPIGPSAGTTMIATIAARKIDRPRPSVQKRDSAGRISRVIFAAPHAGGSRPARRTAPSLQLGWPQVERHGEDRIQPRAPADVDEIVAGERRPFFIGRDAGLEMLHGDWDQYPLPLSRQISGAMMRRPSEETTPSMTTQSPLRSP